MAIIFKKALENGSQWAIWRIDESIDELILLSRNPEKRRNEICNFSHNRRKIEFLATRLLLEQLTNSDVEIDYLPSGKPILKNQNLQISLSHTAGYAAVITHPTNSVGIDIEVISSRIHKIKHKFLSEQELEDVDTQNETSHLLIQWSAKESVYKAINEEGVDFRDEMYIEAFKPLSDGIFHLKETHTKMRKLYVIQYYVTSEYVLTFTLE